VRQRFAARVRIQGRPEWIGDWAYGEATMAVSKRKRFEIFKRDSFTCQYCGRTPPGVVLECDHVTASANGGSDESHNLITSCFDCNRGKSDVPLEVVIPSVTERLLREQEIAEQVKKYNAFLMKLRKQADDDIRELGHAWFNHFMARDKYVFGTARVASIRTFLKKLPKATLLDAIEKAHQKRPVSGESDDQTFKYFCGTCWGIIKAND